MSVTVSILLAVWCIAAVVTVLAISGALGVMPWTARLLDRECPDWWQRVDVNTLSLSDPERCVLGQVFGSYSVGVVALGYSTTPAAFVLPTYAPSWRRIIRRRAKKATK